MILATDRDRLQIGRDRYLHKKGNDTKFFEKENPNGRETAEIGLAMRTKRTKTRTTVAMHVRRSATGDSEYHSEDVNFARGCLHRSFGLQVYKYCVNNKTAFLFRTSIQI